MGSGDRIMLGSSFHLPSTFLGCCVALALTAGCGVSDGTSDSSLDLLGAAGVVSDDFSQPSLDPSVWTIVDPRGDGTVEVTGAGTPDAQLRLSVPAGTSHDAWTTNNSLRVMQAAADEDFELEVKFESEPTQKYQGQGLIVEQDAGNYIRFDVYSDGRSLKAYSARFRNGRPSKRLSQTVAASATTYLRMGRTGDTWTLRHSVDGTSWVTLKTFSYSMTVSSVGVFASNYNPSPAHTAVVDYLFETSAAITPEDPAGCDPSDQFVLTTNATNGEVLRVPDQSLYACGDEVTLTAVPDTGATFAGWGGDLTGAQSPTVITIGADTTITASFDLDETPPQIGGGAALADETFASISWETDEPSTGRVEYGLTASYDFGFVESGALSTDHAVDLVDLSPGTLYHYRVIAEDELGNTSVTLDQTFMTLDTSGSGGMGGAGGDPGTGGSGGVGGDPGTGGSGGDPGTGGSGTVGPGAAGILSDDFRTGSLNEQTWTIVDPRGDSTVSFAGAETADAQMLLSVPEGTKHDPWGTNTALRVMQPAANEDFELEVKFESEPTQKYQGQGLIVEQDAANYIRFDVYSDGNSLNAFSARIQNGKPATRLSQQIPSSPVTYLRLGRTGNDWTLSYSEDGDSWVSLATYSQSLTVSSVGVFASNYNPNPAYTAVVDYFFETSAPIAPEDIALCNPSDQFTLVATSSAGGSVSVDPNQASYECGQTVTLIAQPDPGASFTGWGGDVNGTVNPIAVTIEADLVVSAGFAVDSTPPTLSGIGATAGETSASVYWQTNEASTGLVEYGLTSAYELGSADSATAATSHSVGLSNLLDGTLYHYRIIAADGAGNTAVSGDRTFTTTATGGGSGGPDISVWYGPSQTFGAGGIPQRFVNILGNARDDEGVSSLTYSVNGGPELALKLGKKNLRLQNRGDFNADILYSDLSPGANQVTLRAVDGLGNRSTQVVDINYVDDVVPSENYSIDWSSVSSVSEVAQIVDGKWALSSEGLRVLEIGYDRLVAMGDLNWTNYEALVEVTVNAPVDPDIAPILGLAMRWTGHFDWDGDQPLIGWYPLGGLLGYLWTNSYEGLARWGSDGARTLGSGATPSPEIGGKYLFRMRGEELPGGDVQYSIKMWRADQAEPGSWGLTYTTNGAPSSGSLLLVAHYVDVTLGDVAVVPLGN